MENRVTEDDWESLCGRIASGRCTPFLGAGACVPTLPLGGEIASEWAERYRYPLGDSRDLAKVAQFLAVRQDPMFPKEQIVAQLRARGTPDFSDPGQPHRVLAGLPLPLYLTSNYDDFMGLALEEAGKAPAREFCAWNEQFSVADPDRDALAPTPEAPVVYHLHGRLDDPESLVLTEDDYLDFLVSVSRADLLPPRIQRALSDTSLLFVGYRLADWNFRVLHRGIVAAIAPSRRRLSITVQVPPADESSDAVQQYLDSYFQNMNVRVFWGTAAEFAAELNRRWSRWSDGQPG
jgi:SIR2-like domain